MMEEGKRVKRLKEVGGYNIFPYCLSPAACVVILAKQLSMQNQLDHLLHIEKSLVRT